MFKPHLKLHSISAPELENHFTKLFESIAIKHGYYYVFDDFLDCCINGLSMNFDKSRVESISKKYEQDERYMLGEMVQSWVYIMDKKISLDSDFYDFFGTFYEKQSMSKQRGFAQYFTPAPICQLMASILIDQKRETVMEPTCGSGRLNLAIHSVNHKCLHRANDLDWTCTKMTALNFAVHGVKGLVTCDDGLWPKKSFKGAFLVNYTRAPYIEYIPDCEAAYTLEKMIFPQPEKVEVPQEVAEKYIPENTEKVLNTSFASLSEAGQQLKLF